MDLVIWHQERRRGGGGAGRVARARTYAAVETPGDERARARRTYYTWRV